MLVKSKHTASVNGASIDAIKTRHNAKPLKSNHRDSSDSINLTSAVEKIRKPTRLWTDVEPSLSNASLLTVADLGFKRMTPVQSATIPLFLKNKDVAVQAVTGSGKTLSFLIPTIEILLRREEPLTLHQVGAIIISPTRELAAQIYAVLGSFVPHTPQLRSLLLVGGSDPQVDAERFRLEGGNIIVATPGRLEDILARVSEFNVRSLELLILDEADRLLDLGFTQSLNTILNKLPKQRRTGLFSATQTKELQALIRAVCATSRCQGLRNPVVIECKVEDTQGRTSQQATPTTLNNFYMILETDQKLPQLVHYLAENPHLKIIVFVLTCAMVDYFGKILPELPLIKESGVNICAIHGQMLQKKRTSIYEEFLVADCGVLIATDLIARGVDIPHVDCILQYDAPQDPSFYVHRVGRTARAGKQGEAIVFLLPSETNYIEFLQVKNVPVVEREIGVFADGGVILQQIREQALADRDVMERAQKAFVSFIRAYREHQCSYIFRIPQLDIGLLGTGMALLFMPIMNEIKFKPKNFVAASIIPSELAYLDPRREKQRLQNVESRSEKFANEKIKRELIKIDKEKAFRARLQATKTKRKHTDYEDEWEDLKREERLGRKLKAGKITLAEFEMETGEKINEISGDISSASTTSTGPALEPMDLLSRLARFGDTKAQMDLNEAKALATKKAKKHKIKQATRD